MGNSTDLCNNRSKQIQIVNQVKANRWLMRYGSDTQKTVRHQQLYISQPILREQLEPILDELRNQKYQYLDPDFSAKPIILKSDQQSKRCRWQRPEEVIGQYSVMSFNSQQNILVKGNLNGYIDQIMQYFGTFLIFLQRNLELTSEIIITNNNTFGLHVLKIFVENRSEFLIIDNKFICDQNKRSYVFSQPVINSIWTLIIQKAWMKYLGEIKGIQHHEPFEPYALFVNKPYSVIPLKQNQFDYIKYILSENKNVILESKKQNVVKIGLSGKKYFSVLGHFYINEQFFVLLRNPCGKFGFRGNWAQPTIGQIKKVQQLGYSLDSPGNFIIDESQLNQFNSMTLFHYDQNYKTTEVKIECKVNTTSYVKVTIRSSQYVLFSLLQQDDELFPLMVDLFQVPSYQIIRTDSIWPTKVLRLSETKQYLKGGHYIFLIKPKHNLAKTKNISLKLECYSSEYIDIQQIDESMLIFNNFLLQSAKTVNSKQISKLDFGYKITWLSNRVLIYIKNYHKNGKQIKLDLHFPTLKNLEAVDPNLKQINSKQYCSITLKQEFLLVLQKKQLHKQTSIGEYSITSY